MDNTIGQLPKVRFGDWIGEGWNMFAEQWKVWVLNSLVLSLVTVVPAIGIYIFMFLAVAASAGSSSAGVGFVIIVLMLVAMALIVILSSYLICGMYQTAFKQLRGEPISTRDLFSAGESFPRFLGAVIVVGVLAMIGFLLCIIPAFIVVGALYFTVPLVVERRMSIADAIQASRNATRGDLFMFVLFAIVVSIIAQAGSYLCYVGMLVTWPLQYTIAAVAYRDCFGVPGARSFASKAAPPHSYGAPPPVSYQPPPPQQWQGYGSSPQPSAVPAPPTPAPPLTAPQPQSPTAAVQQSSTGEIICPDCKAQLPATARFCARCGRTLVNT
jgi:uncharacterized membrane protein